jgi:hypothetical protein
MLCESGCMVTWDLVTMSRMDGIGVGYGVVCQLLCEVKREEE